MAMVPIARKNLLADKVRLLVSIGGVTFAVILVLVVRTLYEGYYREVGAFVDGMPVDVWVTQQGSGGLFYPSVIPDSSAERLAGIDGVRRAVAMDRQRMRIDYHGQPVDVIAMAFDVPSASGALLGLPIPQNGQIVIDAATANKFGIHLGDTLMLRGKPFVVSSVTSSAMVGLSGLMIVSWDDGRQLLEVPGYVSSWLVMTNPGVNAETVITAIEATISGVEAFSRTDFANANRSQISGTFLPIIAVLLFVSFLVESAVVALTIYTAVTERLREFGVLKAIGAPTRVLYRIVLQQSAIVCSSGFAIGVPVTYLINQVAGNIVPEFITLMRWQDATLALGVVLAMAVVASIVPIRRISSIDPAEVFRAA